MSASTGAAGPRTAGPPGRPPVLAAKAVAQPLSRTLVGSARLRVAVRCNAVPVAGAGLFAIDDERTPAIPLTRALATSDASGLMVVDLAQLDTGSDQLRLVVGRCGLSTEPVGAPDEAGTSVVELRTLGTVEALFLREDDGSPVAGVELTVSRNLLGDRAVDGSSVPGPSPVWRAASATSDHTGRVVIGGLHPGAYTYRVDAPDDVVLVEGPVRLHTGAGSARCALAAPMAVAVELDHGEWICDDTRITGGCIASLRTARLVELRRRLATSGASGGSRVCVLAFGGGGRVPSADVDGWTTTGLHVRKRVTLRPLRSGEPIVERITAADVVATFTPVQIVLTFVDGAGAPVALGDFSLTPLRGSEVRSDLPRTYIREIRSAHPLHLPPGDYRIDSGRRALAEALPQAVFTVAADLDPEVRITVPRPPALVAWTVRAPGAGAPAMLAAEIVRRGGEVVLRSAVGAQDHEWLPPGEFVISLSAGDVGIRFDVATRAGQTSTLNGELAWIEE